MTITQMQPLKVTFRLAEQVLSPLRQRQATGAGITVRVYASGTHDLLDTGKLTFIDSTVDAASGTIAMAAELANAQMALWPGQRVSVEVEYGLISGALTVPTVAVQQGQIGAYVWLVDDQNKVKATAVKVARYEGDNASISEGLTEGAQVVIEGHAKLADGSEVRAAKPAEAPAKAGDAKPGATASEGAVSGTAEAASPANAQKPNPPGAATP
jgi:multidrug efflux system membrane fusion protein